MNFITHFNNLVLADKVFLIIAGLLCLYIITLFPYQVYKQFKSINKKSKAVKDYFQAIEERIQELEKRCPNEP